MHVLITSDTLNGNWTYTRELVSGLITRGLRVTLVSFGEIPLPEQTAWMDRLHGLAYHPTAFRLDWMEEGQHDFEDASAYLCSLAKEIKADVFHSNHIGYGALPMNIPRVVVAQGDLITWWKSVHGREPKDTAWLRWYKRTLAHGLAGASAVVAPSEWMLNSIRSAYSGGTRELVIHNGRNPIFFNPYVTKEDGVLAIGRLLDPAKQVNLLTQELHPVPICIVGEDPTSEQSSKVPVRADVRFSDGVTGVALRGPQSESQLRMLYSKAAIYAGTSRYEPFGMSVLETNDPASLADAVRMVSSDPQLRRNFANRAFQRARECFNAHRMTDNYIQLYHAVLSRKAFAA
ncbi:MAG: hypothetical protein DMG93_08165 [Acidobacteria bacterium]|nr:MAG: hypothetical protein DMG93_08165 [Acidobacteriota bacterium]